MNKIKQKKSIHSMVSVILNNHEKALFLLSKDSIFVQCKRLSGNELSVLLAVWARMHLFNPVTILKNDFEACVLNAVSYNNKMYPGTFRNGIEEAFACLQEKGYVQHKNKKYFLNEKIIDVLKEVHENIQKTAEGTAVFFL